MQFVPEEPIHPGDILREGSVADARGYLQQAAAELGVEALTARRMRFGASGLLSDIEAVLAGQDSAAVSAAAAHEEFLAPLGERRADFLRDMRLLHAALPARRRERRDGGKPRRARMFSPSTLRYASSPRRSEWRVDTAKRELRSCAAAQPRRRATGLPRRSRCTARTGSRGSIARGRRRARAR